MDGRVTIDLRMAAVPQLGHVRDNRALSATIADSPTKTAQSEPRKRPRRPPA